MTKSNKNHLKVMKNDSIRKKISECLNNNVAEKYLGHYWTKLDLQQLVEDFEYNIILFDLNDPKESYDDEDEFFFKETWDEKRQRGLYVRIRNHTISEIPEVGIRLHKAIFKDFQNTENIKFIVLKLMKEYFFNKKNLNDFNNFDSLNSSLKHIEDYIFKDFTEHYYRKFKRNGDIIFEYGNIYKYSDEDKLSLIHKNEFIDTYESVERMWLWEKEKLEKYNKEYKSVRGFHNLYSVKRSTSDIIDRNGVIVPVFLGKNGTLKIKLTDWKSKTKIYDVHKIIAAAFNDEIIKPSENHTKLYFRDNNKLNVSIENLYWSIPKYKLPKEKKISHGNQKNVYQYDKSFNLIKVHASVNEAVESDTKFTKSNISACCHGKRKSHANFIWSYTPLENSI
ncbi:hypothetical protein [Celeribacter sp.]|uniref:hypothetical protein n=1 Tax=Celeribacter sp. TaxID=1890673 RepID=UPI003A944324